MGTAAAARDRGAGPRRLQPLLGLGILPSVTVPRRWPAWDVAGILHAPGYPSYVIAARLFSLDRALRLRSVFRVALFSAVSAAGLCPRSLFTRCTTVRSGAGAVWPPQLALACSPPEPRCGSTPVTRSTTPLPVFSSATVIVGGSALASDRRVVGSGRGCGRWWSPGGRSVAELPRARVRRCSSQSSLPSTADTNLIIAASAVLAVVVVGASYLFVVVRAATAPAVSWGDAPGAGPAPTAGDDGPFWIHGQQGPQRRQPSRRAARWVIPGAVRPLLRRPDP